jgi:hypothetical protein
MPIVDRRIAAACLAASALLTPFAGFAAAAINDGPSPDHFEPNAWLDAPFTGKAGEAREFTLRFQFPDARIESSVMWSLTLAAADGATLRRWQGEAPIFSDLSQVQVHWDGLDANGKALPPGFYAASLVAQTADPLTLRALADPRTRAHAQRFSRLHEIVQTFDIQVGQPPKPAMPDFQPLPVGADGEAHAKAVAATGSLPYTVYFGNLHSQTNDSDGGGALGSCNSSQPAQTGAFGPADAFAYARGRSLDFLMASEHNHYFDGSSNTNTAANPLVARNRYAAGRTAASTFNSANPGFLAIYGMEWGVIANGGHLNILNADLLAAWEYNSSGQLIGDVFTAKSDYPALYATMRARNWIGQFNHPSTSATDGQFKVGTTLLGFNTDGYEVMVAAEILNSSAFSTNTTESETGRSSYESAFKTFLERGYRIAPTTNQDNHCANWGASYSNRTGVLIPNGTAISASAFEAAMRARRVFATEEKTSQVVLTANGRLMGERFSNAGSLNLVVNFASSAGDTVSKVEIFGGVSGRNGTPAIVATSASASLTPPAGANYYYAKITQADGKLLWSAPVWVDQGAGGGDTTPPTVSASVAGTSGTISLNASASDNVGVASVEFLVDGVSRGSDASSPYSLAFDSRALANGSHTLLARARDAAGNSRDASVAFSVSNTTTATELVLNPSFESGSASWTASTGVITSDAGFAAHTGTWKAWLLGYGTTRTESVYQTIAIPAGSGAATLRFWLAIDTEETGTTAYDTLTAQVRSTTNAVLRTLATYSNANASGYVQRSFDVSAYRGQTVRIYFGGSEDSSLATSFVVDDVSLVVQ